MAKNNNYKDEEELVKVRDYINKYGQENYGISDSMIGWNQKEGGGGSVQLNGQDILGVEANRIEDGRSFANEDEVRGAIDTYATQNNLSRLSQPSVDDELENANTNDSEVGELETGFEDPYSEKIDKYLQGILNREKFEYDPQEDQSYQALEELYEKKGDRAMENTMGAASQMTGGRTNSWSETVAAQEKSRFNDQLLGKVPQLEQAAYQQYMGEQDLNARALDSLMGVSDQKYNRFADERNFERGVFESDRNYNRSVLESERNFNFQSEEADRAAQRWEEEFDYKVSRDQIADQRWLKQFDFDKQQAAIANAFKNRQISLQEAELAQRKIEAEREATQDQADYVNDVVEEETENYLDWAKEQLKAGRSEDEVKNAIFERMASGKIQNKTYENVMNRFPALETDGLEYVGEQYNEMMTAEDPQKWLTETAPYLNSRELEELYRMVPDDDEATKKLISSMLNDYYGR